MTARLEIVSRSPEDTQRLGEVIGELAVSGDVILLTGNLGAGKTCLTQGLARGLDVTGDVLSPSFTIARELRGRLPLFHLDLYRLENPQEIAELGLDEYLTGGGVCVIEWADRAPVLLPADCLRLNLEYLGEDSRRIILEASGPRFERMLGQIEAKVSRGLSTGD